MPVRVRSAVAVCLCLSLFGCSDNSTDPTLPPVLSPIGTRSVLENETLMFGVTAQGDGQSWPDLSTSALPSGAVFTDHQNGTGTFNWTPFTGQEGSYQVVFRALQNGLADSEVVLLLVLSQPPKDSVWITSDTVFAGDTAEVLLMLINPDSAVAGLNVWLESPAGILYDTTTPVTPRFPVTGMTWSTQRHDSIQTLALLMVDFTPPLDFVPPGSGPLFALRFAVSPSQPPGVYAIDTTAVVLPRGVDISYRSGQSIPGVTFIPGQIVVQ